MKTGLNQININTCPGMLTELHNALRICSPGPVFELTI